LCLWAQHSAVRIQFYFDKIEVLIAKKAVDLAKAYQPKLRDGIKVAVEMLNSVAKDERPIPKGECLGVIQVSEPR